MSAKPANLKSEILKLLKEDEEFRYAVAGLIGLKEILERLDRHEEELVKLREDMNRLREDMIEGFRRRDELFKRHEEELIKLRRDMTEGFKRHDEELAKLRKDMMEGFKRYEEELIRLRKDMTEGFKRHDEILERHAAEIARLREDMNAGFRRHDEILKRHEEELIKLREDMNRGFELVNRHIAAIGARWGIMSEEAFREGLRGLLEKELGLKVKRWTAFDETGIVFGYPSQVEIDIAIKDTKLILIEVSSHIRRSDVYQFKRKAELYQRKTGRKPDRLLMIAPYAEARAIEASRELGIEIYTKV